MGAKMIILITSSPVKISYEQDNSDIIKNDLLDNFPTSQGMGLLEFYSVLTHCGPVMS